ncbi:probable methylcrotonoyl-CoA carboxylase beta chain, mitochondrial [Mangifera indica]|uniref:probable methylcrotonoyl-CoA carboxylase beta chain, mitochondrial n=1 Tax=Mangifera indica TaxID=29780 RepID=UPI001CF9AF94|nr:probable methylcrotonoyl-CoA carboxylase beta chain, mitochondrial [Mangifera indica]
MLRVLAKRTSASVLNSDSLELLKRRQLCSLNVLLDGLDRNSEAFVKNSEVMEGLVAQLHSHIQKVLEGGGVEAVKRNMSRNKLLPRQRIDRLIDPGSSFLELSQVVVGTLFLGVLDIFDPFLWVWLLQLWIKCICVIFLQRNTGIIEPYMFHFYAKQCILELELFD